MYHSSSSVDFPLDREVLRWTNISSEIHGSPYCSPLPCPLGGNFYFYFCRCTILFSSGWTEMPLPRKTPLQSLHSRLNLEIKTKWIFSLKVFCDTRLMWLWVRRTVLIWRYSWLNTQNTPFIVLRASTQYGLIDVVGSSKGGMQSSSACQTSDWEHQSPVGKDINI